MGTTALAYLPYLGVGRKVAGFLPGYVKEEGFASGGRFYLLDRIGEWGHRLSWQIPETFLQHRLNAVHLYDLALLVVMGLLALWIWRRTASSDQEIPRRVLLLYLTLLVLSTPSYPWYALLALGFLPMAGRRLLLATLYASGTALLLYLQWWWPGMPHWPLRVVYGGSALALGLVALSYLLARTPWRRLITLPRWSSAVRSGQEV